MIFISYSHKDEAWKDRVVTHLGVLAQDGELELWEDRSIAGGDDWLPEIERAIQSCSAALLLISADFLTSKFILGNEVPALLKRRAQEGIRVIPVIVKPCAWSQVSWLKSIQARPKDGKPLISLTENDAEEALAALVEEILKLASPTHRTPASSDAFCILPEKIDLSKLPLTSGDFLGREMELKLLEDAWADAGRTHVVTLVAPGGVGKTSLVKRWLDNMKADGWRGASKVFGWSFYSQGTSDDRQASDDSFLTDALRWFEIECEPTASPWDKGRLLASAISSERTLLVLDGLEPLQHPPGPLGGQLRAPGVQALLRQLTRAGHSGLCVVTTRERLTDLEDSERCTGRPEGVVIRHDVGNLSDTDGGKLLHRLGVRRAGAATIAEGDAELRAASREVRGHALTLTLVGKYLTLTADGGIGDIRQRDRINFTEAGAETLGGHAFKAMAAYEKWFQSEGESGKRPLAAVRLLGLFDRPANDGCLRALRQEPVIPRLNEPLIGLSDTQWNLTLNRLQECGLVTEIGKVVDAHPLVREFFAQQLRQQNAEGWRAGHQRLYEYLRDNTEDKPLPTLEDLLPLYQAVAHGCNAGLHQEVCDDLYYKRIVRGEENYVAKKLGAFGSELGAIACFFEQPWSHPSLSIRERVQAWLLNYAAFCLRAFGRLLEALDPMRAGLEGFIKRKDWKNAAVVASNLSELELALGEMDRAISDAEQSVIFADSSSDEFQRLSKRTTLADALHQTGKSDEALKCFREAEEMQAQRYPTNPRLGSIGCFRYCDLLLAGPEHIAWQKTLKLGNPSITDFLSDCRAVQERAHQAIKVSEHNNWLLDIAHGHLTLGRATLYSAILEKSAVRTAKQEIDLTVNGLRVSGSFHHLSRGLLTRAWLRYLMQDVAGAKTDLDEAFDIAERGSMKLFLADVHLYRARLFSREQPYPWISPQADLAEARRLIESCGYWRRKAELEDAEKVINA